MATTIELIAKLKDEMSEKLTVIDKNFQRLADNIKRGALVIGGAFMALIGNSIRLAASFEEASDKFDIVFGENAPEARAELEALATELGRSSNKWIGFAATIQDTLVPLGFARDAAAGMSVGLIELAADMSSLSNVPMEQVIVDLQSAIVGNTETLRKYGVVAQETQIQQFALTEGIWDGAEAITAQEKAAAILGLTYAGTADAQGNALETADSFTNTMRSAGDQLHDFQIELGQRLLPIIAELVSEHMPGFISTLENIVPPIVQFVDNVATLANVIADLVTAEATATSNTILFEEALETMGEMMTGDVADGVLTAEEALEKYNEEVRKMSVLATTSMDDMRRWYEIHKAGSVVLIEQRVAVQQFRDSLVELTLVQLQNLRVIMQSMAALPGFSAVSQAAFEQLNAEVTAKLVPSMNILETAADDAAAAFKSFFDQTGGDIDPIVPPGTLTDEDVSRQIERREFIKEAILENMEEIAEQEAGALERRTDAELAAIQLGKQRSIEAREEIRKYEDEAVAARLEKLSEIADIGVSGARDIGQEMIRGVEGWEERALQAIALMALQAAAISIGGPIGGILGFVGSLFQHGGTVRHAQSGTTVPDAGTFGDRHPYLLERGETVTSREHSIMGNLGGERKPNLTINVNLNSTLSTASPGDAVRAGKEINRVLKAGGY